MARSGKPQIELGLAIKRLRVGRSSTQEALAQAAGITVGHLSKIERGLTSPTWGTVVMIASALGISPADLARQAEVEGR
jgi:transcriptional regulator with XRE-family HTH domain